MQWYEWDGDSVPPLISHKEVIWLLLNETKRQMGQRKQTVKVAPIHWVSRSLPSGSKWQPYCLLFCILSGCILSMTIQNLLPKLLYNLWSNQCLFLYFLRTAWVWTINDENHIYETLDDLSENHRFLAVYGDKVLTFHFHSLSTGLCLKTPREEKLKYFTAGLNV